jgi:hypothetical protein
MRWLPDSLDMVMVFPDYTPPENAYWNTLKTNYVPYLHKRGTKVIITLGDLNSATTTGGQDSIGYSSWAKGIYDKWVGEYNLDGIDIDIESSPSGATLTKFLQQPKHCLNILVLNRVQEKHLYTIPIRILLISLFRQLPDTTMYSFRHTEEVQLILQQFPDFMHHTSA